MVSNYLVWCKASIVFLLSITLVCSSLYLFPSAFSSNGTFITKWGGEHGSGDGEMRSPAGIALDQEGEGNVYVADTGNNRIQVFSSNGTLIREWGGGMAVEMAK
jgi:hypothetical protein